MQSDQEAFGCFVSLCLHLISGLRMNVSMSVVWSTKEDQSISCSFQCLLKRSRRHSFSSYSKKNIFTVRNRIRAMFFIIFNCLVSNINYWYHSLFFPLPLIKTLVFNGSISVFKSSASEILRPQVYNNRKMAWFLDIIHCFSFLFSKALNSFLISLIVIGLGSFLSFLENLNLK